MILHFRTLYVESQTAMCLLHQSGVNIYREFRESARFKLNALKLGISIAMNNSVVCGGGEL